MPKQTKQQSAQEIADLVQSRETSLKDLSVTNLRCLAKHYGVSAGGSAGKIRQRLGAILHYKSYRRMVNPSNPPRERMGTKAGRSDVRRGREERPGAKTYLNCPFHDKDKAKEAGAQWDLDKRRWYIPPGKRLSKFAKWLQ